jgi:hypothetical protein
MVEVEYAANIKRYFDKLDPTPINIGDTVRVHKTFRNDPYRGRIGRVISYDVNPALILGMDRGQVRYIIASNKPGLLNYIRSWIGETESEIFTQPRVNLARIKKN